MISLAGFIYELAKDIKESLKWKEEEKLVDLNWIEISGFAEMWKQKGYELRWARPPKIASRKLEGWDIMFEVDKSKRIKRRIITNDTILIGKLKK